MNTKHAKGVICTVIGGIFWGFSGCCGEYLFTQKGVSSEWLTTVRLIISGIILILFSALRYQGKAFSFIKSPSSTVRILLYGTAGLMFCQFSYLKSIQLTNAATGTVIQYLGPVLIMLYVCIRKLKMPNFIEILTLILAVFGTFLIATHGNPTTLVLSPDGLFWCILSAVSVMFYTLLPEKVVPIYGAPIVNGVGMLAGGILLAFIVNFPSLHQDIDLGVILGVSGIILFGTVIAFTLYIYGVSTIGPVKASVIASIEPVSSAVISVVWLKNKFMPIDILGFVMIISTIFILSLNKKDQTKSSEGKE